MATIQLSNATFYKNGESGVSNVVGIERSQPRIVRYEFQAPSEGASAVALRFTDWTDSGAPIPAQLRCCIDQSPDSHTNTSDGSPYTCTLSRSGNAYEGSADIILLPGEWYYCWVFPADHSRYGWIEWPTRSQYATLTTSGAAASVLSCPSGGELGQPLTLSLHRYTGSALHTITATCGSASETVASDIQADSCSWTPPLSWAAQNTTGTDLSVTVTCTTYIGGRAVGTSSVRITLYIPASVIPTCTMQLSDPTGLLDELGTYVQGKSKVTVSASGAGAYGSTIKSYELHVGDFKVYQQKHTFDLPEAGRLYCIAWAIDSRGRQGYTSVYIEVAPYRVPRSEILAIYRCNAEGVEDPQGDHATIVFDASVDPLTAGSARYALKYRVRNAVNWQTQRLASLDGTQQISRGTAIIAADPGLSYECSIEAADRWQPARMSPYRICPVAFALVQIDRDRNAMGVFEQAGADNTISIGGKVVLHKALCPGNIVAMRDLRPGDDLNLITEPGVYSIPDNETAKQISNMPYPAAGRLIVYNSTAQERSERGTWIYEMQRYEGWRSDVPTRMRSMYIGADPNVWIWDEWVAGEGSGNNIGPPGPPGPAVQTTIYSNPTQIPFKDSMELIFYANTAAKFTFGFPKAVSTDLGHRESGWCRFVMTTETDGSLISTKGTREYIQNIDRSKDIAVSCNAVHYIVIVIG